MEFFIFHQVYKNVLKGVKNRSISLYRKFKPSVHGFSHLYKQVSV